MGSNYNHKLTYAVDIVFCIDTTMSMNPILDTVKRNALNFYQDFQRVMNAKKKHVLQLRVRIVAFRDYYYDKEKAMMVTNFFELPAQAEDFETCVKSIEADGGGDDPEDGLEALAYAMKSDWNMNTQKKRHVIVVWSDEGTHDLGFGKVSAHYPKGMAKDFNELTEWWGSRRCPGIMDESAKRLLLFTPSKNSWNMIRDNWNNVIQYESEAGEGLKDYDYDQILNAISNTI
ncbi:MAG: VWA domain-containing protein [Lachnospiraceae bacterium]|nr:VWA domain-containing protein [Lachnospiraceae bacterium]